MALGTPQGLPPMMAGLPWDLSSADRMPPILPRGVPMRLRSYLFSAETASDSLPDMGMGGLYPFGR